MVDEIDIWRSAKVLVKQHREDAGAVAADRLALMQRRNDKAGVAVWQRIIRAVDALMTAVRNREREPALYFRFSFPCTATDAELQYEMDRQAGRVDHGFDSVEDLPLDGPLIVLTAKNKEEAREQAVRLWARRDAFLSDKHMPTGWCMFDQIGRVLDFYEVSQDN